MTIDLLALSWMKLIFLWFFVGVCMLLIGIILLQKGRGGGLSGAFGGAGGQSAFGSKTGDVFTYITIVLAVLYLGGAVANNYMFRGETLPEPAAQAATEAAPAAPVTGGVDAATGAAGTATPGTPAEPADSTPAPATPTPSPN